eukprot:3392386-Rhodomonas_salina.1
MSKRQGAACTSSSCEKVCFQRFDYFKLCRGNGTRDILSKCPGQTMQLLLGGFGATDWTDFEKGRHHQLVARHTTLRRTQPQ